MRRPDPRSLCVIAAGIVLAAGSAGPQPPAVPAAGPPAGGAEPTAADISQAQQAVAGSVIQALGPGGWAGPDGEITAAGGLPDPRPADCSLPGPAAAPGPGSFPVPGPGARRHLLSLQLTGPAPESPETARDLAQAVLLASGAEMLSAVTPGPAAPPETEYTVTAAHADSLVVFTASDYLQKLHITSRCSADPALAATPASSAT